MLEPQARDGEPGALLSLVPGWPALALLAALLAISFQGSRGIWEPDEGFYVNAALGMIRSGDWAVPTLNGAPFLDKPPLHYWGMAAGILALGRNEWGARAMNALFFVATILILAALGSRLYGSATGRLAGLVYATSALPFFAANVLTPDTPLAACAAAAMYGYVRASDADSRGGSAPLWWLALGGAAGLGLLAKGPAMGVFLAPAVVHFVVRRGWRGALGSPWSYAAVLVAIALGGSWYLFVGLKLPGAAAYFLDNQAIGRLATSTYRRNPGLGGGLKVYVPAILLGALPWSLLWPSLVLRLRKERGARSARGGKDAHGGGEARVAEDVRLAGERRMAAEGREAGDARDSAGPSKAPGFLQHPRERWRALRERPGDLLVGLWLALPLVILLAARSRLVLYTLPLFAPLAIATARALAAAIERGAIRPGRRPWIPRTILIVWCLALVAAKGGAAAIASEKDTRAVARRLDASVADRSARIVAVDDKRNGLPFYGYENLAWVTLVPDTYPFFTPVPTLAEELDRPPRPLLPREARAGSSPRHGLERRGAVQPGATRVARVLLVPASSARRAKSLVKRKGYRCRDLGASGDLVIVLCDPEAPHSLRGSAEEPSG
jgi:4-amino-4-deoxy-L-arabinose transferase-like glycosyltransferase